MVKTVKPKYHKLKAHLDSFDLLRCRRSEVQLRKNDRNYKVGDICRFYEYDHLKKIFTGHTTVEMPIVIVLKEHKGLTKGWCLIVLAVPRINICKFEAKLAGKKKL